ncbi:MAG: hypothetical protein ACN6OC_06590 [Alcaligenes sp.]
MNKTPEEIMREADALIEQVQRNLAATADIYRDHGLDPDKLPAEMNEKIQAEAQELFRKDLEDVEREVAEEMSRRSFAAAGPRSGARRKLRNMI